MSPKNQTQPVTMRGGHNVATPLPKPTKTNTPKEPEPKEQKPAASVPPPPEKPPADDTPAQSSE